MTSKYFVALLAIALISLHLMGCNLDDSLEPLDNVPQEEEEEQGCDECQAPANGQAVCEDDRCIIECDPGLDRCDERCVDLQTDPSSCGQCGQSCQSPANGNSSCVEGSCEVECDAGFEVCGRECVDPADDSNPCWEEEREPEDGCEEGLISCDDECIDPLADRFYCGDCDTECPTPANGEAVCDEGSCAILCDEGF